MQLNPKPLTFFKKIFTNPVLYIWLGVFVFCFLLIFNFQGIADFRDTRFTPYFDTPSYKTMFYQFNRWVRESLSIWHNLNLRYELYWQISYSLMFSLGWILSFIFLKKIVEKIVLDKKESDQNKGFFVLNLTYFLLAGLHFFNPYILERFFMGHYYVLWGHSLFIPCLYFVLKWFKNNLEAKNTDLSINFLNFNLDFKKLFSKDFWFLLLVMIFGQMVNVHHGIFLFYFLSICVIVLFVINLFKNFSKDPKQATLNAIFSHINLQFLLVSGINLLLFLLAYIVRDGFQRVNFYLENIANNQNQFEIVRSFSLQTLTDSFTEHVIKGSVGAGNWMSPMVEMQGIRQSLGFWSDFVLQYSFFLQFLVFVILIVFLINLLDIIFTKKEFKTSPALLLIFSSLGLTWILNFGYSYPFFIPFNQLFYNFIPGFYTFREPGKFYSFFLAFLMILIAFWVVVKFSQTNKNTLKLVLINIFLTLLLISNLTPFFLISRHLNYVNYPTIFNTADQFCKENTDQKFIFLPIGTYLVASYSPRIFTTNPSNFYFKHCNFVLFRKMDLQDGRTGEVFNLNATQKSQEFDLIIENFITEKWDKQEFKRSFETFLRENNVNNILIETHTNNKVKTINEFLQQEYELKEQDGIIFWYKVERW